jgi:exonuclease SbcD
MSIPPKPEGIRRLVHVADTHADDRSRLDEHRKVMDFIASSAAEAEADLVVHAGDIYERETTTIEERSEVAHWLTTLSSVIPTVVVRGNHDGQSEIEYLGKYVESRKGIFAHTLPTTDEVGGFQVSTLPWPSRASLLAAVGPCEREQANLVAGQALQNILRGMYLEDKEWGPHVFVGHVEISGATTDKDQPMVDGDMMLTLADLALVGADYYALGHIHHGQQWEIDGAPALYPGAPRHCNFGEPTPGKGFVIADFARTGDRWRCVEVHRIATPCRPMLLLEDSWTAGWTDCAHAYGAVKGAEVRFRYRTLTEHRDAARAGAIKVQARMLIDGAHSVKLEEVVQTQSRARAPEIARARTVEDQFIHWAITRGKDIEPRRDELLSKLARLKQVTA